MHGRAHNGGDLKRLGVNGFCWGGRITWLYAEHNPHVKAAVAWYGRVAGNHTANTPANPIDRVADLQVPVLGLYGLQDSKHSAGHARADEAGDRAGT